MTPVPCRQCAEPVDPRVAVCPHCQAPRPGLSEWHGEGHEWRSEMLWMGSPVIHIAFGNGPDGRVRVARGVIAIGQRAVGGVAIGIVATGFVSIGIVSLGLFSFGVVAVGACTALGVNALAPFAVGVVAGGYAVGGAATFGWKVLFSVTQ